ncbi:MAG TPA: malonate decarboxylase holo-[acyl-carrier-protein] synthase, partial [Burkholderiaceae bacterium]|nr:malonate decarboxylase holo-[acyl-carrier-protein] synthase [Burkholderiaceae bacterium]
AVWAGAGLPLVVTRQRTPRDSEAAPVWLGLSAPNEWSRRLLAVQAPPTHIGWFSEFPPLVDVIDELPRAAHRPLREMASALRRLGVRARAYGSVGWQRITGLAYLHECSDLDLWLAVDDAAQADAAVECLQRCTPGRLHIDGELLFADGRAVAWREWIAWRSGRARALLVKRLDGVEIERSRGPVLAERIE